MAQCIVGKIGRFVAPFAMVALSACGLFAGSPSTLPRVFVLRPEALQLVRASVRAGHTDLSALDRLRAQAERVLRLRPVSVTDKAAIPPSGDKHDYMSLAPYWWPDPQSGNGLPYIRRDGQRNPEISTIPDHKNFGTVTSSAHTLALAYYMFGDERYAAKATELLRVWFISPRTRMNPNLEFAQAVKGHNLGRGTGLIETRGIAKVVDSVGLLAGSRAWTGSDQRAFQDWCSKFLDWMLTSSKGRDEAAANNNHGTYYDVQVAALALFTGRKEVARSTLTNAAKRRIAVQIEPGGAQPLELARTKSFSYSVFNLIALFDLARLGENLGVDLWFFQSKDGRSIRAALDYLLPVATGKREWKYRQFETITSHDLAPLLLEAAERYHEPSYRAAALKIGPEVQQKLEALLNSQPIAAGAAAGNGQMHSAGKQSN